MLKNILDKNKYMSKFLEQSKVDNLITQVTSSYIRIIVEKNCGYKFMVLLNNEALLSDLYREVELVYGYLNTPLNIYYGNNYIRNKENVVNNPTCDAANKTDESNSSTCSKRCNKCIDNQYYDSGERVFIPKNNKKFRDYVNEINLEPCTKLPSKVCYRVYLDICDKH